jgi:hypothetical protein
MREKNRFLVVTECKGTGYVVGFYNELPEAEKVIDELDSYNDSLCSLEGQQHYEKAMNYLKYRVHSTCFAYPLENCPRGIFYGDYVTSVFDTSHVEGFTLKMFLFERANTIFAFNFTEYVNKPRTYAQLDLTFIAN